MMGIGIQEIAVVGVIIILIFGGKKFAELGKGLGSGIHNFRRGISGKIKDEEDVDAGR